MSDTTVHVPAVLLLHGQPGSPADWQFVSSLIYKTAKILIPERPGYGNNPLPAGDFAFNAKAMIDLLDANEVRRVIVVGYSWSGGVAIEMAAKYPERVAGLVLVASIGPGAVGILDNIMALPILSRLTADIAVRIGGAALHPRLRKPVNLLLESRLRNAVRSILRRDSHKRLADTFVVEQKAMVAQLPTLVEMLPSIKAPTVVLHAQRDLLIPKAVGQSLSVMIPGSRLIELAKGSHYLPHYHASFVAEAINSLLDQAGNTW